jgi:cytochrome c556
MSSAFRVVVILALVLTTVNFTGASEKKKPSEADKARAWMKQKVQFSQGILSGLTEGDFDKIRINAQAINVLTYMEKWSWADRPEYKQQMRAFEAANKELLRQAKAKNIEGATLAYNELTVSCVRCHQVVRKAKK